MDFLCWVAPVSERRILSATAIGGGFQPSMRWTDHNPDETQIQNFFVIALWSFMETVRRGLRHPDTGNKLVRYPSGIILPLRYPTARCHVGREQ